MRTIRLLSALFIILAIIISCQRKEYVEMTYVNIYQADSLYFRGKASNSISIAATCSWSKEFEKESRRFYMEVDSNLVYKGWRRKVTDKNCQQDFWSAIDWRFTKIEFITKENYDSSHPAGSSLNDLLYIEYDYKYNYVQKRLSDVVYGNMMLTDYYPYNEYYSILRFTKIDGSATLPNDFIIRFHDAFGRVFTVDSDDWKFPSEYN